MAQANLSVTTTRMVQPAVVFTEDQSRIRTGWVRFDNRRRRYSFLLTGVDERSLLSSLSAIFCRGALQRRQPFRQTRSACESTPDRFVGVAIPPRDAWFSFLPGTRSI